MRRAADRVAWRWPLRYRPRPQRAQQPQLQTLRRPGELRCAAYPRRGRLSRQLSECATFPCTTDSINSLGIMTRTHPKHGSGSGRLPVRHAVHARRAIHRKERSSFYGCSIRDHHRRRLKGAPAQAHATRTTAWQTVVSPPQPELVDNRFAGELLGATCPVLTHACARNSRREDLHCTPEPAHVTAARRAPQ
jgi:hypothetical protein